jgi:hypothetical protein
MGQVEAFGVGVNEELHDDIPELSLLRVIRAGPPPS